MATTNRIALAVWWSEKYCFAPNFPKSGGEEEKEEEEEEDWENRQM